MKNYIAIFQRLLRENHKKGRDHEVVCEYLKIRDSEISQFDLAAYGGIYNFLGEQRNNKELHDRIFQKLERLFLPCNS